MPLKTNVGKVALGDSCLQFSPQGPIANYEQRDAFRETLPGAHQHSHAFLRRKPADKQGVLPGAPARTGIGVNEVWLDKDLVCRKPSLDEHPTREVGESDIAIHLDPGTPPAMGLQHEGDRGRRCTGPAVAPVAYSAPQAVVHTLAAHATTPKEGCRRAKEPVVMQTLHHRNARLKARRVNRGRGHDKGVMD